MNSEAVSDFEHHRVLTLLPWWINGTLDAEEQQLVAQHLVDCASCRNECDLLERCNEACTRDAVPVPDTDLALARVLQRIDQSSSTSREGSDQATPVRTAMRPNPSGQSRTRSARWISASAAAVLIAGVVLLMLPANDADKADGEYTVLSSDATTQETLNLEVRFRDRATASAGVGHVQQNFADASMVTGWEKADALTYRFMVDASITPEALSQVLEALSSSETVSRAALVMP